jgi:hypothetical protein
VLFGGRLSNATVADDTWEFDGQWQPITTAQAPSPRTAATMAFDPARQRITLFGGIAQDSATVFGDTWEFDGTTWTAMSHDGPAPRINAAMVADTARGGLVLFGGVGLRQGHNDTWLWRDQQWQPVHAALLPPATQHMGMFYEPARNRIVFVAGTTALGAPRFATYALQYLSQAQLPDECVQATVDSDGDGLLGCADPDCTYRCAPTCSPLQTCAAPHCGDGVCDRHANREDEAICPTDCLR